MTEEFDRSKHLDPTQDINLQVSRSQLQADATNLAQSIAAAQRKAREEGLTIPEILDISHNVREQQASRLPPSGPQHGKEIGETAHIINKKGTNTATDGEPVNEATSFRKNATLAAWTGMERNVTDFPDSKMTEFKQLAIPELMPTLDPCKLGYLGNSRLRTSYSAEEYTAGEGFLMRCIADYFNVLPFIGHSVKTLKVLHAVYRRFARKDIVDDVSIEEGLRAVDQSHFGILAVTISQFIIPPMHAASKSLDDTMGLIEMVELIEEVDRGDLDVRTCFNAIGHAVELYPQQLSSIPEMLQFSELIMSFVDSVAKGNEPKEYIHLRFETVYSGNIYADPVEMDEEIASLKQQVTGNKPSDKKGKGKKVVSTVQSTGTADKLKAANVSEVRYVNPSGTRSTESLPVTENRGGGSKRQRLNIQYATKSELAEIVRKQETYFGQHSDKINLLHKKVDQMMEILGSFNENLVDTISRLAYSDLCKRVSDANLGKADLNKPEDRARLREEGKKIANEVKTMSIRKEKGGLGRMSSKKKEVIQRLQQRTLREIEALALVSDIQELVKGTSREAIGQNINSTKLKTTGYRERLIAQLKETPEPEQESDQASTHELADES